MYVIKEKFYLVRFFKEEIFFGVCIDFVVFVSLVVVYVYNYKFIYIGVEFY